MCPNGKKKSIRTISSVMIEIIFQKQKNELEDQVRVLTESYRNLTEKHKVLETNISSLLKTARLVEPACFKNNYG